MLTYLIKRPLAVCTLFTTLVGIGILGYLQLPTSLMPQVDVPHLRVQVSYPQGNPRFIEKSVLQPMRTALSSIYGLEGMESVSTSGVGQIDISLNYGTDVKLTYLEVNEKLDQIITRFPEDMLRPVVHQVNPTDIPIIRVQMVAPNHSANARSDLARFVVSRRLEQIPGVSLVETNGVTDKIIRIRPDEPRLHGLGLVSTDISRTLQEANISLRQIHVKDGIYAYNIVFNSLLTSVESLSQLQIVKEDRRIPLTEVANIEMTHARRIGLHLFRGEDGVVFAVHMQSSAQMKKVEKVIQETIQDLQRLYPEVSFSLTQNQGALLASTIFQLLGSLVLGAIVAFLMLFLFSGEGRSPILMGVLLPTSLALTFLLMLILGMTINLVTISGLILGVGILIDNGIIIIDNISAKVKSLGMVDACSEGVTEVAPAMFSSLLTTLCVFIPLVFIGDVAGALFTEQIIALTLVLVSSLMVSFLLLPVLYKVVSPRPDAQHSRVFEWTLGKYQKSKGSEKWILLTLGLITLVGILVFFPLKKDNLPNILTADAEILIYWSQPISIEKNEEWTKNLAVSANAKSWEAEVGMSALREGEVNVVHQTRMYLNFEDPDEKAYALIHLEKAIDELDERAVVRLTRARNPYDQLFTESSDYARIKFRTTTETLISDSSLNENIGIQSMKTGFGFQQQRAMELRPITERLDLFDISQQDIIGTVAQHLNDQTITTVTKLNEALPITISGSQELEALREIQFVVNDSLTYPLRYFMTLVPSKEAKFYTADQVGLYQDVRFSEELPDWGVTKAEISNLSASSGWLQSIDGRVIELDKNYRTMLGAILLAICLLYVILVAQFESFAAPLVILSEIPVAIAGAILVLYLFGQSLNISSLMGIIITLGIIVNDSILKLDTILRLRRSGMSRDEAINKAGKDRLKPILMTTLTTIIALVPVLFTSGFGGGIQYPMIIAIIGGLTVGTVCSIYLMPAVYKVVSREQSIIN